MDGVAATKNGPASREAGPSRSRGSAAAAFAPYTERLPRSDFLSIEYPGILRPTKKRRTERRNDADMMSVDEIPACDSSDDDIDEDLDTSPLARALSSLSPTPPPHNTPGIALNHIANVLHENTRLLECRLEAAAHPLHASSEDQGADNLDVYRHPIAGDILPTHDILCKITKRVWRRVRYTQRDRESTAADEREPEVKEYSIELLGPISNTVRFRRMADFAFQPEFAPHVPGERPDNTLVMRTSNGQYGPDVGAPRAASSSTAQNSSDSDTVDLGGSVSILKLQSMLRRMDFDAISKFRFAEPNSTYVEDEGVDGDAADSSSSKVKRSVAYLVPPPIFSRQEIPFPYHYKHSMGSNLVAIPKGDGQVERRYMNVQHYRGAGPTGIMLGSLKDAIPQGPDSIHERQLKYIDRATLEKIRKLFDERPIWSKLALINQFGPNEPFNLFNSKFYLPHVSYIIYDGPFRDSMVRYGYNPRREPESRLTNTSVNKLVTTRKKKALLQAPPETPQAPQAVDEDEEDQDGDEDGDVEMDDVTGSAARRRPPIEQNALNASDTPQPDIPSDDPKRTTHIFDGTSNPALTAMVNYSLIDIVDPLVQKYIYVEGKVNIRSSLDMKTGWYTRLAFERMKAAVSVRVKVARFESRLATAEEVEAAVLARMGDLKRGRAGSAPSEGEEDVGWWADHIDEQMMASTEPRDSW
ncbi:tau 95 subunit of transcription factor TFIIIC [Tilletia horrida]|uniref:Tau 95 subunit of transcription factor TFIIIC n=1 Tax=Tilletia horrida TaxID=155126 RepID=A0AAN6GJ78_9BASI|nr:tau 95 subunit of transcription factor TFIIIC [Tilletia horrida]KAK0561410.1 tau 95 subunit of transcription factor TFIIIC [Tilletia horrida]